MLRTLRVLLVEDSEDDAALLARTLRRDGIDAVLERVDTAERMNAALDAGGWDVVLSDFTMPRFSGSAAFSLFHGKALDIPFIFVSGTVGEDSAVKAMKLGASDYFLKDNLARLAPAIEREVRERDNRAAHKRAESELRQTLTETEEQLRQSQKMEAVGRLAGGVAHDFNNMLSVILSYSVLLTSTMAEGDPRIADLAEIQNAGKRAADLTRQLLLFSRQESLPQQVLDLNELLAGLQKLLQRAVGEDVELACLPCGTPARIRANPGHVEQVLMNLVINARDAMPTGGRLTIETSAVGSHRSSLSDSGLPLPAHAAPHVLVSVTDTGTGMDAATRARIFEPFFTTKERGKGTGLGLSTVFGIMRQSGGAVDVVSEPGKGATFNVYFPLVDAAVDSPAMPTQSASLRGTEAILLVEDEASVRNVVRNILSRHGYEVLEARSPEEALSIARRRPEIDLLISDVVMPRIDGPELSRRIVKLRPEVRVLFMSGYTDDSLIRYSVDSDVAFLEKPLTPESLTRKVREVLDRTSVRCADGERGGGDGRGPGEGGAR
jgi:two-component system cell cycle sensor histidine kinase/response regulator CckA